VGGGGQGSREIQKQVGRMMNREQEGRSILTGEDRHGDKHADRMTGMGKQGNTVQI